MVTDINGIPSAMIKRVEIISGGASATYGADAIGGVTNFILRDDFQGLEVDLRASRHVPWRRPRQRDYRCRVL